MAMHQAMMAGCVSCIPNAKSGAERITSVQAHWMNLVPWLCLDITCECGTFCGVGVVDRDWHETLFFYTQEFPNQDKIDSLPPGLQKLGVDALAYDYPMGPSKAYANRVLLLVYN